MLGRVSKKTWWISVILSLSRSTVLKKSLLFFVCSHLRETTPPSCSDRIVVITISPPLNTNFPGEFKHTKIRDSKLFVGQTHCNGHVCQFKVHLPETHMRRTHVLLAAERRHGDGSSHSEDGKTVCKPPVHPLLLEWNVSVCVYRLNINVAQYQVCWHV